MNSFNGITSTAGHLTIPYAKVVSAKVLEERAWEGYNALPSYANFSRWSEAMQKYMRLYSEYMNRSQLRTTETQFLAAKAV